MISRFVYGEWSMEFICISYMIIMYCKIGDLRVSKVVFKSLFCIVSLKCIVLKMMILVVF